jgi:hypothetical protein
MAERAATGVVLGQTGGSKLTTTATVGASQTATYAQYAAGTTVTVTATSPSGSKLTSLDAQVSSEVDYVEQSAAGSLTVAEMRLTDPEPGTWTFEITLGGEALTFGKLSEVSDLSATFEVSGLTFGAGSPVTARIAVTPAGAAVSGATATFRSPDGQVTVVTLLDDGAWPDSAPGDHVFSGSLTTPTDPGALGRWSVDGRVTGTHGGAAFDRSGVVLFDLTEGQVVTTGTYASTAVDADGDGVVEELAVDVGLRVNQAGDYVVNGTLTGPGGKLAGHARTLVEGAGVGGRIVRLGFDAAQVASVGTSGRFALSELVLSDVTGEPAVVSAQQGAWETDVLDLQAFLLDGTPQLQVVAPSAGSGLARDAFTVRWQDADPDDDARISFYLDADPFGADGTPIAEAQGLSEDEETDAREVDVSALAEGEYWVYGVIEDGESSVVTYATAPLRVGVDTDGDGLLDSYETAEGLDPLSADADADFDRDRLTNGYEAGYGTSPSKPDTDRGGERDGRELFYGRAPLSAGDDVALPWSAALGDVAPAGAPDGRVNVGDVVRLLRFSVGIDVATAEEMVRGDVAPAALTGDPTAVPVRFLRVGDARLNVADVVVALNASVGRVTIVEWR